MTIYNCSVCGKTHDSATDPACPQTIAVGALFDQPVSPNLSAPQWERRYFCPQCPLPLPGGRGFSQPEFVEHAASHASAYLREALTELARLNGALREMEGNIRAIPGLALMYVDLALLRAFHHRDREAWKAWESKAQVATPCAVCAGTKR